jgi:hypothetical protein
MAGASCRCNCGSNSCFAFKKVGDKKKKFIWEFPNYYSEKDDKLWQEYKENHPEDFMELPYKRKTISGIIG